MKLNKSKLFLIMPRFILILLNFLIFADTMYSDCFGLSRSQRNLPTLCKCEKFISCVFECLCVQYGRDPEGFEMRGEDAIC